MEEFFAIRFWIGTSIASIWVMIILYALIKASKYLLFSAPFKMTDEHRFIQGQQQKSKKQKKEKEQLVTFPKSIRFGTMCCLSAFLLGLIFMCLSIYHLCIAAQSTNYSIAYSLFGANMWYVCNTVLYMYIHTQLLLLGTLVAFP